MSNRYLIVPQSFQELIIELDKVQIMLGSKVLYRGQNNIVWSINSELYRMIQKQESALDNDCNLQYIKEAKNYFSSFEPTKELIDTLQGKGCYKFEIFRTHKQNYSKAKIHGIENFKGGSPIIDFSGDKFVSLFFANFEINFETLTLNDSRENDAVLYVISWENLMVYDNIDNFIIKEFCDEDYVRPRNACIICPSHQINDKNDQKPKRQDAFYIIQPDFRSIEETLLEIETKTGKQQFFKIKISKELFNECKSFLFENGYDLNSLFPK